MDDGELEDLLNRSLINYSVAEPLTGLEDRVLAHVRSSPVRHLTGGGAFWKWAIVPALVAAVLIGFRQKEPIKIQTMPTQSMALVSHAQPELAKTASHRPVMKKRKSILPRLSDQELLLVRFVKADPVEAVKTLAGMREMADREVTVEPLKVDPISVPSLEEAEKL